MVKNMPKIKTLSDALITKIAAGEVIERPASVVKELLENSLDAGADEISIEIMEGGVSLIRIKDNGEGMDREDSIRCIVRHATSKLTTENDLTHISTLGFRGEALAAVAAVSHMTIQTNDGGKTGTQIEVEFGELKKTSDIAHPRGTTITVRNLFGNAPVRKKYLKVMATEYQAILDLVTRFVLGNPALQMSLSHNEEKVLFSPKTTDALENIISVYGKDIAKHMIEVNYTAHKIRLSGYTSMPELTRGTKQFQTLFLNGRYVQSSLIQKAIMEAYHTLLFEHRYPLVVLSITMDPTMVDVNVHPQKMQVRLLQENVLHQIVYDGLRESLLAARLIPAVETRSPQIYRESPKTANSRPKYPLVHDKQENLVVETIALREMEADEKDPFTLLGQANKSFIVCEEEDGLLIVDQHAAHERINFEKNMQEYHTHSPPSQELLDPVPLELSAADFAVFSSTKELFAKQGFRIEEFGGTTAIVRAVPLNLHSQIEPGFFFRLLDLIQKKSSDQEREHIIATMSCRESTKFGDDLSGVEMKQLVRTLAKCKNPYTCPHGRPTMIRLGWNEMLRRFKRIG